jgi:hypothetical protein
MKKINLLGKIILLIDKKKKKKKKIFKKIYK